MKLEFYKDGKKVECCAIFSKGVVGQVVILDFVSYGDNPDLEKNPLAAYPQPYAFTIVKKVEGKDGFYTLRDSDGNLIKVQDAGFGASDGNLYDANMWLAFKKEQGEEKLRRKEHKIELLGAHIDLLKSILTAQGVRVITEEQAKTLGLAQ